MPSRSPLLDRIEGEHPEWLGSPRRAAAPAGVREGSFVLSLRSADRRPGVEVVVEEREALVRVGLHERLFVWPPDEADEAAGEVIAYLERVTRTDPSTGAMGGRVADLEREQRRVLREVDALLRERGAVSDLRVAGRAAGRQAELVLLLPPERRLDVTVRIAPDAFEVDANGASLRLARIDFGNDGAAWVEGCLALTRALLSHDLVLRTRRTLTGRRVGAVLVPGERGGSWNGEPLASLGLGRTRTFPRWWSAR